MGRVVHARLRGVLQRSDELFMQDTCAWLLWTQTRDADNQETGETWTVNGTSPCQFQLARGVNVALTNESGTNQVVTVDRVRVPVGAFAGISSRDRIRITHRFGVALTPAEEYAIDGAPSLSLTVVTIKLKRVSNG